MAIDSVVDIITNSSSELFVLDKLSKLEAEESVAKVYPMFKQEYRPVMGIDELDNDELCSYLSYAYDFGHMWSVRRSEAERALENSGLDIPFDMVFEANDMTESIARHGELTYTTRYDFVTDANRDRIIDMIDPDRQLWFMYSIGENPNWDMQENLMQIATRYHLG
jgi:phosphoglycolate phosphatase-like HAD superfamily hydrolase